MDKVAEKFSARGSARQWNDMYATETEDLQEHNFRRRRDFTVDYILSAARPDACILDLGCGTGPVVSELRRHGRQCIGVDYASDMLGYAKARLRSMSLDDSNLLQGDSLRIPFRSATFDIVICLGVISFVEDKEAMLKEIRRILKPGGTFIISFRNKFNPVFSDPIIFSKTVVEAVFGIKKEEFRIGQFLDPRVIKASMKALGFRYVECTGIGFGPFCFCKRRLLSEKTSIKLSGVLTRFFIAGHMERQIRISKFEFRICFQISLPTSSSRRPQAVEPSRSRQRR
jgi:ubiquinone/menaquinone biosynthesis C-methylase UbiE